MEHKVKIYHEYLIAIIDGRKPFEIRLNDRNYQVDDIVILKEYNGTCYTGCECHVRIKEIFSLDKIGLKDYIAFTFNILYYGFN